MLAYLRALFKCTLGSTNILKVPFVIDFEEWFSIQPCCHITKRRHIRREQSVTEGKNEYLAKRLHTGSLHNIDVSRESELDSPVRATPHLYRRTIIDRALRVPRLYKLYMMHVQANEEDKYSVGVGDANSSFRGVLVSTRRR